ncbi:MULTISPECIES: putative holin-like toxin [Lysinibacillus]|uniref:Holin-like toxin n=1 Tax=Lysinibacillus xylanilyticus TaxID=582475 RepID=A0ABT4ELY0_9BACI|nr:MULTISPECIES: putative holin-like toxin [Lysinibacillus]MCY9546533.1 putative holin-like toxin [Lysinibacillus xylanilyticus]MDM5247512.1 putative holin-like toxin [Lysinibacillus sp. G4S2]MED3802523.1 putative holin-like toxin [Lysinibacillus xylanilyticus]
MTVFEAFSLIVQCGLLLIAVLTLMLSIIVSQNKKK